MLNLTNELGKCKPILQEMMLEHFYHCDPDFAKRVAEGIGVAVPASAMATAD